MIAQAQVKQADSYNKGCRLPKFPVGSLALVNPHSLEWIESKGEGSKLVQKWIGPFEIMERINPKVYRLRMDDRYPGSSVINMDHLRPYIPSPEEMGPQAKLPDTRTLKPESEEYEVDFLVGHKYDKCTRKNKYLIHWKGYSPLHDTCEMETALRNAPEILRAYKCSRNL